MELRHLRYFVAVAEELNFTRAAERLRTAQPSLSQQIRDLEEEIGTPLLARTKRRVELTEPGRVFLDEARLVLAQVRRAVALARKAAEVGERRLTIGFVPAAEVKIFPGILSVMQQRFPDLRLEFRNLTTVEQREALARHEIDVGFLRSPLHDPALVSEVVLSEHLVAVLPADHPLAAETAIDSASLTDLPFLRISPPHAGNLHDCIKAYFHAHRVKPQLLQDVENISTLMTLIGMGVGFSLLPDYADGLVFRNVVTRPLADPAPPIDLVMAWRRGETGPELTSFLERVRETVAPRLR